METDPYRGIRQACTNAHRFCSVDGLRSTRNDPVARDLLEESASVIQCIMEHVRSIPILNTILGHDDNFRLHLDHLREQTRDAVVPGEEENEWLMSLTLCARGRVDTLMLSRLVESNIGGLEERIGLSAHQEDLTGWRSKTADAMQRIRALTSPEHCAASVASVRRWEQVQRSFDEVIGMSSLLSISLNSRSPEVDARLQAPDDPHTAWEEDKPCRQQYQEAFSPLSPIIQRAPLRESAQLASCVAFSAEHFRKLHTQSAIRERLLRDDTRW